MYSKKNPHLKELVQVFKSQDANPEIIAEAGERFLLTLYGYSGVKKAAARQHSFRTYHQIQQWCGVEKNAKQWGWQKSKDGLIPVTTLQPFATEALLKLISCKCKKGCRGACGCRKAGLKCFIICTNCNGACDNIQIQLQDSDEEKNTEEGTVLEQSYDKVAAEADIEEIPVVTLHKRSYSKILFREILS